MKQARGVTLIELMVALTITLTLAALLVAVTDSTLRLWRRAQDTFTIDTEAKLVLDTLQRDLHTALFRADGATWFAVDVISTPSLLTTHGWRTTGTLKPATIESLNLLPVASDGKPPQIADARFGLSGAWVRLIAVNLEAKGSGNPGGSQPSAISYQIARRPLSGSISASNSATVRYTLFRSAVANDTTVEIGLNLLAPGYTSATSAFPGARSSRSLTNPNTADALASNVIDLGVWLYRRDSSGTLVRLFPSSAADTSHSVTQASEFPEVAEVMLRILTEEGARAISTVESGDGSVVRPADLTAAQWWWRTAEAHSKVFVRRVELKGALR
jgi:prepilin-type N-terminal cleavage/methylation domain-containing protein